MCISYLMSKNVTSLSKKNYLFKRIEETRGPVESFKNAVH